jgi:uncharacterized membrane protein YhaH (DUF805 family)
MQRDLRFVLWLFFSLRGRIGRAQWWAGVALLLIISLPSIITVLDEDLTKRYFVEIALFDLATLYPYYALAAKRFHDRDRSGLWGLFVVGINVLLIGLDFLSFTELYEDSELEWIFSGALLTVTLWNLVDLGCARGVVGPNRFGPDPLLARIEQS